MSDRELSCPECGSNLFDVEGGCMACGFKPAASGPGRYFKLTHNGKRSRKRRGKASPKSDRPVEEPLRPGTVVLRPRRAPEDAKLAKTSLRPMQVAHTKNVLTTVFCDPNGAPIVSQGMMSRAQGNGKAAQRSRRFDRSSLNEDKFASCPRCNAPVKYKNLTRHLRRAHGLEDRMAHSERLEANPAPKKSAAKSKRKGRRQPNSQKPTQGRRSSGSSRSTQESYRQSFYDPMDATHDYYRSFRETGRFGSHPVHDGFDDESGPD